MHDNDIHSFIAFLREEEKRSRDDNLDDDRALALQFYNGEPLGDEVEGRSQLVTRDVAEVIDYMTVSILDTMVSGDKAVEFEHADKKIAEEATAAITRDYRQGRRGYRFLHDWIKAGLLEKSSIAKVMVEEQPPKRREATVSIDELSMLEDQGIKIVEAEDNGDGSYNIAVSEPQPPEFVEYVSPNENTGFANDATDLDCDCVYLRFSTARTLSQLAEMGFQTVGLADGQTMPTSGLPEARDGAQRDYRSFGTTRTGSNRKVMHHEEYARYDLNGDGISELMLVHRVADTILRRVDTGELAVELIDDQPSVVWCPFPMPHRIVGQSLADKVMDIQVSRSTMMRQAMDNLYQSNAPRLAISESAIGVNTIDDMLTAQSGAVVRYKGMQGPTPLTVPFVADAAFKAMEIMSGEKESRTGITRLNQGLDADALNKTATGTALMQAQGQQMELYVARNFAESFARLVLKKYHLMRVHGKPVELIIDGEARMVDPTKWPEDMNVIARVGLGSGSKEGRLQHRMVLLQIAQQAIMSGSRTFTDDNIYNNVKGLIADANLGSVRDLITDPTTLPEAEPKPDPAMAKAQADSILAAQKQKGDEADAQAKHLLAAEQMQVDALLEQQRLDADLQAKREVAALDAELARDKANFEAELAQQQADREYALALDQQARMHELAMQNAQHSHEQAMSRQDGLSTHRPGGSLDA